MRLSKYFEMERLGVPRYYAREAANAVRRWSPWHLRSALTDIEDWLRDERGMMGDDHGNTTVEILLRYAFFALEGDSLDRAIESAEKVRVEGGTLIIDGTKP